MCSANLTLSATHSLSLVVNEVAMERAATADVAFICFHREPSDILCLTSKPGLYHR